MLYETPMIVIGVLSIVFSFVLQSTGSYTKYWNKNGSVHSGIWEWCNTTDCYEFDLKGNYIYKCV
jgi:hypothetical protein